MNSMKGQIKHGCLESLQWLSKHQGLGLSLKLLHYNTSCFQGSISEALGALDFCNARFMSLELYSSSHSHLHQQGCEATAQVIPDPDGNPEIRDVKHTCVQDHTSRK